MTNRFNIFGESSTHNGSDRLFQLSTLQSKMLAFAMQKFPNAKKIVYSTCSINVEENEQVLLLYSFLSLFFNNSDENYDLGDSTSIGIYR